jgi:hypothetical protein
VLFRLTSEIRVNRLMPELLNTLPVFNLSSLQEIANLVGLLIFNGLITDKIVHFKVLEFGVFLES